MEFDDLVDEQVDRIQECVAFFPKGKHMRNELTFLLHAMIGPETQSKRGLEWTQEDRLKWLCDVLVRELAEWPKRGIAEVRGIYCETFVPADGKTLWSQLANIPKPPMGKRLPVDDGIPRIGASPVDAEFVTAIEMVAKAKRG
jgi:hypothetical protein